MPSLLNKIAALTVALAASVSIGSAVAAPVTDVQDYSNNTATEYFVDSDANTYLLPYYRRQNDDWGWLHNAIAGAFSSITLQVSAFDVDFSDGELDLIEIFNGSSWVSLGNLNGGSDVWAFTDFDLTGFAWAQSQVNAGLQVRVNIDTNGAGWAVTLGKAVLSVDGGNQQCVPTPGQPCVSELPEPGSLALMGLALGALAIVRRRRGISAR